MSDTGTRGSSGTHDLTEADFALEAGECITPELNSYRNPGPTDTLRGVEPNTARSFAESAPMVSDVTGELHGDFDAPDCSGVTSFGLHVVPGSPGPDDV